MASSAAPGRLPPTPVCLASMGEGTQAMDAAEFRRAIRLYDAASSAAQQRGDRRCAVQALSNRMGAHIGALQYREAAATFQEARSLAEQLGDWETVGVLAGNMSSLYARMDDVHAARSMAAIADIAFTRQGPSPYRMLLTLQQARLAAWQEPPPVQVPLAHAQVSGLHRAAWDAQMRAALPVFRAAIGQADEQDAAASQALIWESLGVAWLRRGRLPEAEEALLSGYRVRKLRKVPLPPSAYRNLGLLREAQGRLPEADRLLSQAVEALQGGGSGLPTWALLYRRGLIALRRGHRTDALRDLRAAASHARALRVAVLPEERSRQSFDAGLADVYAALVEAADGGGPDGERLMLEAHEENRAISLREVPTAAEWLPDGYTETLQRYRRALLRGENGPDVASLRDSLAEQELRAGLALPASGEGDGDLVRALQAKLGEGQAFFSFRLGDHASFRWTVTRQGMRLRRLPPRAEILALAREARQEIEQARGVAQDRLGELLFGALDAPADSARAWVLSVDEELGQVPFAALRVSGAFVVDRHAIQGVPGMGVYHPLAVPAGAHLLAVADPVYNAADRRWKGGPVASSGAPQARLPEGAREAERCARVWGRPGAETLLGEAATAAGVREALRRGPAIAHFATHVWQRDAQPDNGMVLLSLRPDGQPDVLDSREIALSRFPVGLVVLNGCRSGAGQAPKAAGVAGLTRAWLAAGARNVVASRWPTPDDGELFAEFYRHYDGRNAARALQAAQQAMLQAGGWRAEPRYWAAYFVMGRG